MKPMVLVAAGVVASVVALEGTRRETSVPHRVTLEDDGLIRQLVYRWTL